MRSGFKRESLLQDTNSMQAVFNEALLTYSDMSILELASRVGNHNQGARPELT